VPIAEMSTDPKQPSRFEKKNHHWARRRLTAWRRPTAQTLVKASGIGRQQPQPRTWTRRQGA
jgi:hypothetical protein